MNKLGIVLGAAAIVAAAGCMDPDYKLPGHLQSQNEPAQVLPDSPSVATPIPGEVVPVPMEGCRCAPGTVHSAPCACGAPDCQCIVEEPVHVVTVEPVPAPVVEPAPAPVPETTTYIVQPGDYLAKISKKYNIKLDSIRKANPNLKGDNIRVGQKLQLPGKVDVGEQKLPPKPPRPAAAEYRPYEGATKEYVVVAGDSLGKIAYSNGINIRQLKELNGLSGNTIRIGQKLKIPASKPAPAVAAKTPAAAPAPAAAKAAAPAPKPVAPAPVVVEKETLSETVLTPEETTPEPVLTPDSEPALDVQPAPSVDASSDDVITYVVQEGEDIAGVAVTFTVDPAVIREINNLGPDEQLKPGQVVKIPASAL